MTFTAKYIDAGHSTMARSDRPGMIIPADTSNRHFQEILEEGCSIADYEAPAVTRADVNAERDRRNEADFEFQGAVYQADLISQRRLEKARLSALVAVMAGSALGDYRWHGEAVDFFWIAKDNSQVKMDAQTVIDFGNALAAREGLLIAAASRIKAMAPIPADFTDNDIWSAQDA